MHRHLFERTSLEGTRSSAGAKAIACAAVFLGASCVRDYQGEASDVFAHDFSCPADRQTITPGKPPPDVADDPARMRLWREDHHDFQISGCGKTSMMTCQPTGDATRIPPLAFCTPQLGIEQTVEAILAPGQTNEPAPAPAPSASAEAPPSVSDPLGHR